MTKSELASGSEKGFLSTCFRKVLCETYGLTKYIADEIDAEFKDERACELFQMLKTSEHLTFILAVTHNEAVKDMFQHDPEANIYEVNPETGRIEKVN